MSETTPEADCHRLRRADNLRGEQLRNKYRRRSGLGQRRPVTDLTQPGVFAGVKHIDRRQWSIGVRGHDRQHPDEALEECVVVGLVEHRGVVFDAKTQFGAG